MKRRDFLKVLAATGAAMTVKVSGAMSLLTSIGSTSTPSESAAPKVAVPDLVAIMGGEPDQMFRRAIKEVGGMGRYVKKGDKVVVKPNIGWDKSPEMAANTNPKLVSEVIKQCLAAGASEVIVFDHTCDDWRKCYVNSGIEAAAKAAGAKVMSGNDESYYKEVSLPKGDRLQSTQIHKAIVDCDVWINMPILKNHGGAKMSISMKNYMGIVWDRGVFHKNDLQQCIADVCTYEKRPALNIVDAYRVMKSNGPRGKSEADVALAKGLFLSSDFVAVDTAATAFFNQIEKMPLEDVKHIEQGERHRLGTTKLEQLNVKRIKI